MTCSTWVLVDNTMNCNQFCIIAFFFNFVFYFLYNSRILTVKYGAPFVLTLTSVFHGNLYLTRQLFTCSNILFPVVSVLIDPIDTNSSINRKSEVHAFTKINNWAVSFLPILSSRAIENHVIESNIVNNCLIRLLSMFNKCFVFL